MDCSLSVSTWMVFMAIAAGSAGAQPRFIYDSVDRGVSARNGQYSTDHESFQSSTTSLGPYSAALMTENWGWGGAEARQTSVLGESEISLHSYVLATGGLGNMTYGIGRLYLEATFAVSEEVLHFQITGMRHQFAFDANIRLQEVATGNVLINRVGWEEVGEYFFEQERLFPNTLYHLSISTECYGYTQLIVTPEGIIEDTSTAIDETNLRVIVPAGPGSLLLAAGLAAAGRRRRQ